VAVGGDDAPNVPARISCFAPDDDVDARPGPTQLELPGVFLPSLRDSPFPPQLAMRDYYAECVLGVPAPPDDHEPYDTWEHGRAPWSAARAELHIEDVRIAHERAEVAKARAKKEAEAKRREHLLPPRADVAHPFGAPRDARRVANARAIPPTRQETFNRWVWEEAEDLKDLAVLD
jgi:hypothetical protein